jgi:hypothetical protein
MMEGVNEKETKMGKSNVFLKLLQFFVAPAVVGILVVFGQALLQPWVSGEIHTKTEHWNAKRSAFVQALAVVDKQFAAHPFDVGPDATKVPVQAAKEPDPSEINSAYNNLVLIADNRNIVDAFLGCLGAREGQSTVWHEERVRLLKLMRAELGFEPLDLKPEDVRFWVKKLQQSDTTNGVSPRR